MADKVFDVALDEFDIIRKYFASSELAFGANEVVLGVGDDCALIAPRENELLAVSMDMLVEGVHFLEDADPFLLGQRTMLVNLSDLAAMGAEPLCFTLALSLPNADERWLAQFSAGLAVVAQANNCPLVGGDMTASDPDRGGRTLCVQVHGSVPHGMGLTRSGAKVGDLVYVTGTLGDAAAGLRFLRDGMGDKPLTEECQQYLCSAFYQPESRIEVGIALRDIATSAIDLSDGLASDLRHILGASRVGASVNVASLPLSQALRAFIPQDEWTSLALSGGDDYELCFTLPQAREALALDVLAELDVAAHCIGKIESEPGMRWLEGEESINLSVEGYKHF